MKEGGETPSYKGEREAQRDEKMRCEGFGGGWPLCRECLEARRVNEDNKLWNEVRMRGRSKF